MSHMTLKLLLNRVFLRKNAKILPYIRDVIMDVITLRFTISVCNSI